jgi:hypothetical protein
MSFIYSKANNTQSSSSSQDLLKIKTHKSKLIRKDSVETLDSIGSSNSKNSNFLLLSSQDDLDYQNLTSPSSTSGISSPSVLSYLSNYSLSNNSTTHQLTTSTATATNTIIPTRFIDRRVSQPSQDPHKYNVNISEAGSRLARAAQEQLKVAEKLKDTKHQQQQSQQQNESATIYSHSKLTKQRSESLNDNFETPEDWQNVSKKIK